MAITPITNYMPMHRNSINFSGKNNKNEQQYEHNSTKPSQLSGLRKVPVIVMLAMSPINMQNIQAKPLPEPVTTTVSAPSSKSSNPVAIGNTDILTDKLEDIPAKYYFIKLDIDGNKKNAEMLTFRFEYVSPIDGLHQLDGIVRGICPEPDKKNRYLMEFECTSFDETYTISKVCNVPAKFAKYILNLTKTPMGENLGIRTNKNHLINKYNRRTVEKPGFIFQETNVVFDKNGKPKRIKPLNDGIRDKMGHTVIVHK